MTNHYEYTTFDAAQDAIEGIFSDFSDRDPDEIGYDVVESVAAQCTPEVAAEVRRCFGV